MKGPLLAFMEPIVFPEFRQDPAYHVAFSSLLGEMIEFDWFVFYLGGGCKIFYGFYHGIQAFRWLLQPPTSEGFLQGKTWDPY